MVIIGDGFMELAKINREMLSSIAKNKACLEKIF